MPAEHRVDPTWLEVVATQLARSSSAALEASHELLAHYGDSGHAPTQRTVDTLINRATGALADLSDSLSDTSRVLAEAARGTTTRADAHEAATCKRGEAGGSSTRSGRPSDHGA